MSAALLLLSFSLPLVGVDCFIASWHAFRTVSGTVDRSAATLCAVSLWRSRVICTVAMDLQGACSWLISTFWWGIPCG